MVNICLYLIASNNLKLQHLPSSISPPPPSFLDTPLLWAFELLKISLLKFPHTKEKIVVKNTPPNVFVEGKIRDHDFLHNQDLVVLLLSHSLMKVNYLPFKNTSIFNPLMPEWPASNFSFQFHPWIKRQGHKNRGNDNLQKNQLIVKQILFASTLGNVLRPVWRIWVLMFACKGLEI